MDQRLTPGQTIDGLTVQRRIGAGGAGTTYLVRNDRIDRNECMKVINSPVSADDGRSWEEARHASATGIPGVVTVYSAGTIDGSPWFTMEYAPYGDLRRAVNTILPATAPNQAKLHLTLNLLADVASALDTLHSRTPPMIHGDIKPGNILVFDSPDGSVQAKLADFGLSAAIDGFTDSIRSPAPVSGTLPYLAPERFLGAAPSPDSDRYAFACSAFELITQHRAFTPHTNLSDGDLSSQIDAYRKSHQSSQRPTPSSVDPALRNLDDVFSRALARTPEIRHQTAMEFHESLCRALGHQTDNRSHPSRRKGLRSASVATGVACAIVAGLFFTPFDRIMENGPAPSSDEESLPFNSGCPNLDSWKYPGVGHQDTHLTDQYRQLIDVDIEDDCTYAPTPNFLGTNNWVGGFSMIYVFNRTDRKTVEKRDAVLERTLGKGSTYREDRSQLEISATYSRATLQQTIATGIPGLTIDGTDDQSSACVLSSRDATFTVLQINHGWTPTRGAGKLPTSRTCGGAIILIKGWMDSAN